MARYNPKGVRPKVPGATGPAPNPIPESDVLACLWIGTCDVYEYKNVVDSHTHQTTQTLEKVLEGVPCRLSYLTPFASDLNPADIGEIDQKPTLFCATDWNIKPGSVVEVTQLGRTRRFYRSSEPAKYTNHQQIRLELNEDA